MVRVVIENHYGPDEYYESVEFTTMQEAWLWLKRGGHKLVTIYVDYTVQVKPQRPHARDYWEYLQTKRGDQPTYYVDLYDPDLDCII